MRPDVGSFFSFFGSWDNFANLPTVDLLYPCLITFRDPEDLQNNLIGMDNKTNNDHNSETVGSNNSTLKYTEINTSGSGKSID